MSKEERSMKILYLFNGSRKGLVDKVKRGENHGDGFWGMLRLPHYGITAEYVELEDYFPESIALFIRKHLNIYFIHILFFWKIFFYDIVFTSSAFGTQLLYSVLFLKRPLWVMHDFSIMSLVGEEKTFKQKLFAFMVGRSAGVVTLSLREKDLVLERFPELAGKVEFIPFGVDTDFFSPREANYSGKPFVLAVGFDPDRDWKTLVSAAKNIDIDFVIATRPERVKKLVPLPSNVKVAQFELRDLVEEYNKALAVVVPLDTSGGFNDAMGCSTLFEAMAMQKPVIVTETLTTSSYVVDGENALLVKEGDAGDLSQKIEKVIGDAELRERLGKNARQYVVSHLDAEEKARELADYFKALI